MSELKKFTDVYNCDSITLNVTDGCNIACRYCFEHDKHPAIMKPQTAIDIVDAAYNKVSSGVGTFTINIFGGEPLLNWPAIKAVLDHCAEKKYKTKMGITTNLTLLTDEMIKYFDDYEVMLMVSIDGIKKVHDRNRCGTYDTVVKNIHRLIDAGLALFIEARLTIMPEDAKYAAEGVKELIEMGINNLCPMAVVDVAWSKEHLAELKQCYLDMFELYFSYMNDETCKRNISIKNTNDILVNVMSPEVDDPLMCPIYSDKWCCFDTNADVYPCHQCPTSTEDRKKMTKIGNLYTGIDMSKFACKDVHTPYLKEQCKDCIGKAICKGGCISENWRMTGDEHIPSDDYCNTRIVLVEATRKYQHKLLHATNIRNRQLVILKENLKLKDYADTIYHNTNLSDRLTAVTRITHLKEMIDGMDQFILPTFRIYLDNIITTVLTYYLSASGISIQDAGKLVKEEKVNG